MIRLLPILTLFSFIWATIAQALPFPTEIPDPNHCISNTIQHPLGARGGLTELERRNWDKLRVKFNKERAKTEILRRESNG
jgi:hypothetical protein